jgi:uncharacterized protein YfaS (alpha-2-macroglobulin family)
MYWIMSKKPARPAEMLRLVFLILILVSLACSLPGFGQPEPEMLPSEPTAQPTLPPMPTPTPRPLPPALIESLPSPGAEAPLNGPITLFFNQAMNRSSVETALSGQFSQAMRFNWLDDQTLALEPQAPLPPESTLSFVIDAPATSAQGLGLLHPISLSYLTAGYLELAQILPAPDSIEIDPTSAVVAAFNRPVVPLGADSDDLPPAFEISPPASGRGEWINTSTYIFYPQPALAGGTQYTVTPNSSLTSLDGGPLRETQAWRFSTAMPALVSVTPLSEKPWPLDAEITLTFNQPMDPASVQASFALLGPDGVPTPGQASWNETNTVFMFKPSALLQRQALYTLSLSAQAESLGGAVLGQALQMQVVTMGDFAVVGSRPAPGELVNPYSGVALIVSAPVNERQILNYIRIDPLVDELDAHWNEFNQQITISGRFDWNTAYTLTVAAGLSDRWGSPLDQPFTLAFRTERPQPSLLVIPGGEALFLTPGDAGLTVQATNVFEVPLSVAPVSLTDFLALADAKNYQFRQTYQNPQQFSWQQALDIEPDRSQTVQIPLSPEGAAPQPGLYYVRFNFRSQNANSRLYDSSYLLVVSNIQITYKTSSSDALVWAVDLRTNQPLSNAPVTLYAEDGSLLGSGQTDSLGVFRTTYQPLDDPYTQSYAVIGQPGQDIFSLAFSGWTQGIAAWDFDASFSDQPPGLMAYIYSDRPIYRPGQTVYFRAIVRQSANGRYALPQITSLPLQIFDDMGNQVAEFDLPLSAFGAAHGQFDLPESALPGYYTITNPDIHKANLSFQVANYRKPEINLQVGFANHQVQAGEKLNAQIEARYFFDAPAGNAPVRWVLYATPDQFSIPNYQVGIEDMRWLDAFNFNRFGFGGGGFGLIVAEGEGRTTPDGKLALELPTQASQTLQHYILEVTVEDESGLPVSNRASAFVNPADFYIGVRPDAWVGRANEVSGFSILTVDWERQPVRASSLRAAFSRVVWQRKDPSSLEEGRQPEYTPQYTLIGSVDFITGEDGQARLAFIPPTPGVYQLEIFDPALPTESGPRTQFTLWVGGAGQAIWPNLPNSRLRLTVDRSSYAPGETAQVFIPNPFGRPAPGLITVERGQVISHQALQVGAEGLNFQLPLSEDYAPNVYVSVTLLGQNESGKPDFRYGLVNLSVEPQALVLQATLTSQPQRAGPGQEATLDILVTDAGGRPVQGEFSLSVVDLAVLALAEPNALDISEAFYGEQPNGVRTGISLTAYSQRLVFSPLGLGGGGGADIPSVVRERFPDTAFWNAQVNTGPDGRARVTFQLPDTLTTWQVDLRGVTLDSLVGQAQTQIVATKDVLARPVTPRFLVVGDRTLLAAIVQNNTASDLQAEATLQASGVTLQSPASQSLRVPANGRARVEWWVVAQDAPTADLVFTVSAQDAAGNTYQDATRPAGGALPVLRYLAPQTFRTSGVLDAAGQVTELISLPRRFTPLGGELSIELAPSLAAAMLNALDVLEHSPYESTEQTLSRFLPNLETYRVLQAYGLEAPALKARLDRTLSSGVLRLQSRQNFDGGWSWQQDAPSDATITTYVVFGLLRARDAGVQINQFMLENALDYLQSQAGASAFVPGRAGLSFSPGLERLAAIWRNQSEAPSYDRLAFQEYVLALAGRGNFTRALNLYQSPQSLAKLNPWGRALLALTLEQLQPGNLQAVTLLSDLQSAALRSATGVHWELQQGVEASRAARYEMQTNLSNSAIVMVALAQRDPGSPLLADAMRYLMAHRQADGGWFGSYTTAWTLIAMSQLIKGTGELGGNFAFSAFLNGSPLAEGQAGGSDQLTPATALAPARRLYAEYPNVVQIERQPGPGRLYYSLGLRVFQPVESVAPLGQGVTVERAYYPLSNACNGACAPLQSAQAGQQIVVRLTLTLPREAFYLAVEDFIPAGAEILNFSLKTSQQGEGIEAQGQVVDPRNPFANGWGWWLFNPARIYDDHISWTANYLAPGTYQLTYTLVLLQAGEYRVLPARAWQLYFPEVQGNSAGAVFEITP